MAAPVVVQTALAGTNGYAGAVLAKALNAFGSSVTVGNYIVVCLSADPTSGANVASATVTDNKGNTYTKQVAGACSAGGGVGIWTAPVTTGGAGLIVSYSGVTTGTSTWATASEVSGATGMDGTGSNLTPTTSNFTIAVTTTNANDLIFSVSNENDGGGGTVATTGQTTIAADSEGNTTASFNVQIKTVSASGAQTIQSGINGNGTANKSAGVALALAGAASSPTTIQAVVKPKPYPGVGPFPLAVKTAVAPQPWYGPIVWSNTPGPLTSIVTLPNVPKGALIVALVIYAPATNPTINVSDGRQYQPVAQVYNTNDGEGAAFFKLTSASAGTHVISATGSNSSAGPIIIAFWCYADDMVGSPVTNTQAYVGSGVDFVNAGTLRPPVPQCKILAFGQGGPTPTPGTSFQQIVGLPIYTGQAFQDTCLEWRQLDNTAPIAVTFSASANGSFTSMAVLLTPFTGAPSAMEVLPTPSPFGGPHKLIPRPTVAPATVAPTITATGAAAIIEGADTAVGTGIASTTGSGAATEVADTAVGIGATSTAGTGAATESADTAAGTGSAGASGAGAAAEIADTVSGAGTAGTTGSGAATESADTAAGVGATSTTGTASITEGSDVASGSGSAGANGTGAATESSDTAAGIGATSTTGSGAATESGDTASGTGSAGTTGTGTATEQSDTASGAGAAGGAGSASITEASDTASGAGSTSTAGSAAIQSGQDVAIGTGTASTSGSGAATQSPDVASGIGTAGAVGVAGITEGADTAAGVGTASASGAGAATEQPDTVAGVGTGTTTATGSGAALSPQDIAAGTGSSSTAGSGAAASPQDLAVGAGVIGLQLVSQTPYYVSALVGRVFTVKRAPLGLVASLSTRLFATRRAALSTTVALITRAFTAKLQTGNPPMTTAFSAIDPTEAVVLTFDFTLGLAAGETLTGTPTVTVTVAFGTDPNAAAIVKGQAISGSTVLVQVSGCLDETDYHFRVVSTTSNSAKVLTCAGLLPVRVQ
jgi:hypothetical protein